MLKQHSLYIAWLIATLAMLVSLYQSEVRDLLPCKLCWFTRMFLFPLPLLLFPIVYMHKTEVIPYIISLPLGGMFLSAHQIYKEVHCTHCIHSNLSLLSLVTFILITFFLVLALIVGEKTTNSKRQK